MSKVAFPDTLKPPVILTWLLRVIFIIVFAGDTSVELSCVFSIQKSKSPLPVSPPLRLKNIPPLKILLLWLLLVAPNPNPTYSSFPLEPLVVTRSKPAKMALLNVLTCILLSGLGCENPTLPFGRIDIFALVISAFVLSWVFRVQKCMAFLP